MVFNSPIYWADQASQNVLGPVSQMRGPDFTFAFEQAILSIIPSIILLSVGPVRLLYLSRSDRKTRSDHEFHLSKLVAASVNLGLHISLLVLWSVSLSVRTSTSILTKALGLANAVIIIGLSHVEDRKSIRPSSLLTIYLLFTILFDATQVRTLWMTHRVAIAWVQTAIIGTKIAMLVLETREKTPYLKTPYNQYFPEATRGIINLSFVWWMNSLFITGYRKVIGSRDLFDLDPDLASAVAGEKLRRAWDKHGDPHDKRSLPWVFIRCFWREFLSVVFPRLCIMGFNFAQPFLITAAIKYVEDKRIPQDRNNGYSLIGAAFLIYLGIALSNVHYKQRFSRVTTLFRGTMIALIHGRTLTLRDGLYTESAALTLMSTDVDGIIENLENFNDVWARTIEVVIGTWLLGRQVGAICAVPLILILVCLGGQKIVATTIGKDQQNWNLEIQKRVKKTSSVLGSMKATKISGLLDGLAQNLQEHRERELFISRAFLKGIVWLNGLATVPRIWSSVIIFIIYAVQAQIRDGDSLTTVKAFTTLSIITLVTSPAERLLAVIPQLAAAMGCFERIHEYIVSEPAKDRRLGEESDPPISTTHLSHEGQKLPRVLVKSYESEISIALNNITVWPSQKATCPALTDLTFKTRAGTLVAVTGPVGSGKTTLLKIILGELDYQTGTVYVRSRRISYCSQSPWLLNTTIKNSITGLPDHDVDEKWYQTVLHSCCLDEDIRRWPEGDQSEIGSKGLTLSGGQKQRVALARAVYSRQDIALLDDVLSALDVRTQSMIIERLLSRDGIFRELKTTVVLVTHNVQLLRIADSVVSLGLNGQIELQTTAGDEIGHLILTQSLQSSDQSQKDDLDETNSFSESTLGPTDDMENLNDARQVGDLSVYLYYARIVGPVLFAAFISCQAFLAFAENFPRVWLSMWTEAGGRQLPLYLSVYVALAFAASFFMMMFIWVMFLEIMPKSAIRLHWLLLDAVIQAPLSFFSSTDSGVTLNRFSQDMNLVDLALPIALSFTGQAFFGCIAAISLIATGSSFMVLTIPFTLIVLFLLQRVYLKTSRQLRFLDLEARSPLYSHFTEVLDGLPTIRAFGWQAASTEVLIKHLDESQKPYYTLFCAQRWLNLVLDIVVMVLATIVVALAVELRGSTNAGLLGVALNNILGFNQSLSSFITSWTTLETSLGAIVRIKTFVETTPSESQPGENSEAPVTWPEKGRINIQDLSLIYDDGTLALEDISMLISPGEKIGICGRTGSGKSSLILALLRLVNPSQGKITIDGIDCASISPAAIRESLVAVPQDPFTLLGSVRYNVDIAGASNDTEIMSVLKQVGIWKAIETRGGLDAVLEDHPLSQGEQQLFCLARAILKKRTSTGGCRVLILDEATSSMDVETDRQTQRILREAFRDCTVVSVAHRLDTIIDFDRIAVLDAGRLIEFDTPQNLLAREGGQFGRMYAAR
ncbi:putative multidrug resistance protein [Aspergillus ellipticus CBS 707.79]|uniref:Putative multidrug resistance protein n=1 Tax=Aspergillus ellipticus CBS 707.79 TaxID=1448320 RepID=A0A319DF52_9EURO|nr:putative multidrug resistance protein [Aspergillus ellipticus CBS 707.79]